MLKIKEVKKAYEAKESEIDKKVIDIICETIVAPLGTLNFEAHGCE